ncbi:hypothetical protein GMA8713_04752 [Grimontia marina]|uniref:Uncharacterized protein n=1 Tax=Grimontia marina TaxID=646534 RepID=A0A128FIU5_9GAMM|nr:hypothetical protein GMA8713_04752 [Grimontia marina]
MQNNHDFYQVPLTFSDYFHSSLLHFFTRPRLQSVASPDEKKTMRLKGSTTLPFGFYSSFVTQADGEN